MSCAIWIMNHVTTPRLPRHLKSRYETWKRRLKKTLSMVLGRADWCAILFVLSLLASRRSDRGPGDRESATPRSFKTAPATPPRPRGWYVDGWWMDGCDGAPATLHTIGAFGLCFSFCTLVAWSWTQSVRESRSHGPSRSGVRSVLAVWRWRFGHGSSRPVVFIWPCL